ncbi:MAG TPA: cytochrome P450 [Longimicrobium sp.]|jgi:cytochrome P450
MRYPDRAVRLIARLRRRFAGVPAPDAVDLTDPALLHDPFPRYAALREKGPVHFLPRQKLWLVLGYDEVASAFKDPEHFSSVHQPVRFDPVLNEADPPAHTAVRRSTAPFFSASATAGLEERARGFAAGLVDELSDRDEVELVRDFAAPLVERMAGALLGLDASACEALRARLGRYGAGEQEEQFRELDAWAREQAAAPPAASVAAGLHGAAFAPEAAAGLLKLFWVAGTTTTGRLVSSCALYLLRDPALRAELSADPSLIAAMVDEVARLEPPEVLVWRVARPGAELAGTAIPAGAEVRLCVGAANRDPRRFPDPNRLSLRRAPNPHLTFGAGPHFCPGSRLARLQVRAAVEAILTRAPHFRATRPLSAVTYAPSPNYRGLNELHASLRAPSGA